MMSKAIVVKEVELIVSRDGTVLLCTWGGFFPFTVYEIRPMKKLFPLKESFDYSFIVKEALHSQEPQENSSE